MSQSRNYVWMERKPRWMAFGVAVVAFFPICLGLGYALAILLHALFDGGEECIALGMLVGGTISYYVARFLFSYIRWVKVIDTGEFCIYCNYSLRGNVSGACPECGSRTRARRQSVAGQTGINKNLEEPAIRTEEVEGDPGED